MIVFRFEQCSVSSVRLGEFGVYDLIHDGSKECTFTEALEPANANLALLYSFLALLGVGLVYRAMVWIRRSTIGVRTERTIRQRLKTVGFDVEVRIFFTSVQIGFVPFQLYILSIVQYAVSYLLAVA